jgi:hypothetical protein
LSTLAEMDKVEAVEHICLGLPQVEMPVTHSFAPGVYMREILMPAGSFVIGHRHNTEHFNVILCGLCRVLMENEVAELRGPCSFVSKPGVRKVLHVIEETRWATIHPLAGLENCGQDVDRLEERLIIKSSAFLEHAERKKLI